MVYIPATLRRKVGIDVGNIVAIDVTREKIILTRYTPTACAICGTEEDTISIKDKYLCNSCIDSILATSK